MTHSFKGTSSYASVRMRSVPHSFIMPFFHPFTGRPRLTRYSPRMSQTTQPEIGLKPPYRRNNGTQKVVFHRLKQLSPPIIAYPAHRRVRSAGSPLTRRPPREAGLWRRLIRHETPAKSDRKHLRVATFSDDVGYARATDSCCKVRCLSLADALTACH